MRILMLGNSLTYYNDMPRLLADRTEAEVVAYTRGGARLAEHLDPESELGQKTLPALENETWDYVIMQEYSNGPILERGSFFKSVDQLCRLARRAGAEPVLYATWAYLPDHPGYQELDEDERTYEDMTSNLYSSYREIAEDNCALIAQVGWEFYRHYRRGTEKELYDEDGLHPSLAGSELAAKMLARVILENEKKRLPVTNVTLPGIAEGDTRLRLLHIYRVLEQYSDEDHQLSTNEIREIMEREYGTTMHRTTVSADIEALRGAGFRVMARRRRQNRYYLMRSEFELSEVKLLIDAVAASKFITKNKSEVLIEKLTRLTGPNNAAALKRNMITSDRVKSPNEKGYQIVDVLNQAINEGKRVSFFYTDIDAKLKRVKRNEGKPYLVSPYNLIWNGEYYYLVGFSHDRGELRTYRVDRIADRPKMTRTAAEPRPEDYDPSIYTKEVFRMYTTGEEPVEVTLFGENEMLKGIVDKFGLDIMVQRVDENHFRALVRVCTSPTFYAWVFQWGGKLQIEDPDNVVNEYKKMIENIRDSFS